MVTTRTFTLVPVGGLGNRLFAISSALAYCQAKDINLKIIWFKDHGLNCDYNKLFSLAPGLENVEIWNATYLDLLLRDNPRRRNFWIPRFFESLNYDKRVYCYEYKFKIQSEDPSEDMSLDGYDNIFMVSYCKYWNFESPLRWFVLSDIVRRRVDEQKQLFTSDMVGIHVRRTDNIDAIKYSPTSLYVEKMKEEIQRNPDVKFYLSSDSNEEKERLKKEFAKRIVTTSREVVRNSEEGIIDAFVEMNLLASTRKIYAGNSTFSMLAALLSGVELCNLDIRNSKCV